MSDVPAISVKDLQKAYRTPFRRKKVEALRGVTFDVERGHIFGFVGPNGAGKTTTIRTLMGLIRPSGGSATILGHTIPSREARKRVGFLPESPYFYDYLTVDELLDLAGRLFGLPSALRKKRADELIEKVGLGRARTQNLKKFSKGMLQRAGLAQALMNDPELVVLDEPMSGLDPIGRKEVRDLILELRDQGKTVFFSTHILSDVEAITDRVAIVARGALQAIGTPAELVNRTVLGVDISVRIAADKAIDALVVGAERVRRLGDDLSLTLPADADTDAWLDRARAAGAKIVSIAPRHETLEDLFMRQVQSADAKSPADALTKAPATVARMDAAQAPNDAPTTSPRTDAPRAPKDSPTTVPRTDVAQAPKDAPTMSPQTDATAAPKDTDAPKNAPKDTDAPKDADEPNDVPTEAKR